jgi:hypothetical protein
MNSRALLLATLGSFLITSCTEPNRQSPFPIDLLANGSFEQGGTPSWTDWTTNDTSMVRLVADVPSGGGIYSLSAQGLTMRVFSAQCTVAVVSGTHTYLFDFWAKSVPDSLGRIDLVQVSSIVGVPQTTNSISVLDTTWKYYWSRFSVDGSQYRTIRIRAWTIGDGTTNFDLLRLQQLD